ncbi:MAG TPA: hypothetical protein VFX60_16075, partial [Micromonospora sp.]|nr:hypothetical protein [Micromonospora sp.]
LMRVDTITAVASTRDRTGTASDGAGDHVTVSREEAFAAVGGYASEQASLRRTRRRRASRRPSVSDGPLRVSD